MAVSIMGSHAHSHIAERIKNDRSTELLETKADFCSNVAVRAALLSEQTLDRLAERIFQLPNLQMDRLKVGVDRDRLAEVL